MQFSKDYKKIKGDASFRKFYKNKKTKTILVYAKKEKISLDQLVTLALMEYLRTKHSSIKADIDV